MDDIAAVRQQADSVNAQETDAGRRERILREEAIIATAESDIAAGLGFDDDVVEAWFDSLETDPEAQLPPARDILTRQ